MNPNKYMSDQILEFEEILPIFKSKCSEQILASADLIIDCFRSGNKLLICGNGGSAADAQHFAAEFVSSFSKQITRESFPALSLTTDSSFITAFANDFSFDEIFSRQIESLGKTGDILIAITTSGASTNCLKAVSQAKKQGLKTLAFTKVGGEIARYTDLAIQIPSDNTQHIQEFHVISYHIIAGMVEIQMSGLKSSE